MHVWSITHEFVVDWEVYYTKVKHNTKQALFLSLLCELFPCYVNYKTRYYC